MFLSNRTGKHSRVLHRLLQEMSGYVSEILSRVMVALPGRQCKAGVVVTRNFYPIHRGNYASSQNHAKESSPWQAHLHLINRLGSSGLAHSLVTMMASI